MSLDHHNHAFDGGTPDIPYGVGDRFYAQDLARDFWFLYGASAYMVREQYSAFPVLLTDTYIEKGTLWTDLDIPIARGLVEYEVDVPNSFAAIPPTVKQEDAILMVESTAQTNFDISASATLDGVTTNYVKLSYAEANVASRNRAKKAGSYNYEQSRSFTITVSAAAPTNKDVVLAEVVGDGSSFLTITRKVRTPKIDEPFDYVVRSQTDFNQIITRVAANQYKIIDSINSVKVKNLTGGYQCAGASSFLESGDTWGYIETNNCKHVKFESGAFLDFDNTQGYLKVNTDDAVLENVDIQGTGTVTSAIAQSFLLDGERVYYKNCKTSTRLSSTDFAGFRGSATGLDNNTSKYDNCVVTALDSDGGEVYAFKNCKQITNCYVADLDTQVGGTAVKAFDNCDNINNCIVTDLQATANNSTIAFNSSENISNCKISTLDATGTGDVFAMYESNYITNCEISDLDAADRVYAMYYCNYTQNIYIHDLDSSGGQIIACQTCNQATNIEIYDLLADTFCQGFAGGAFLTNCYVHQLEGTNETSAFGSGCSILSGCEAQNIDCTGSQEAFGFKSCNTLSACKALIIASNGSFAYGFDGCDRISGCDADNITSSGDHAYGYRNCDDISSCRANNVDHDGAVAAKNAYGFYNSLRISACIATDIDTNGGGGVANGFANCQWGSSLWTDETANAGNDYIDTTDAAIANQFSCHPTNWT